MSSIAQKSPQIDAAEIIASLRVGLLVLDRQLRIEFVGEGFQRTFGMASDDLVGSHFAEMGDGVWNVPQLIDALSKMVETGRTLDGLELEHIFSGTDRRTLRFDASMVVGEGGGPPRVLLSVQDVTRAALAARALDDQRRLAQGMIDTVRSPLLVLDDELRIVTASSSYFSTFRARPDDTIGRRLWDLGDGHWAIPELIHLLSNVIPLQQTLTDFEVRQAYPVIGERAVLLNAARIEQGNGEAHSLLLSMEDITDRRADERTQQAELVGSQRLLEELNHRVMNTLTTISALIAVESRSLSDAEAKQAFRRMSERIATVGALYRNLTHSNSVDSVNAEEYLEAIAKDALGSLDAANSDISLDLRIAPIALTTRTAVPLGLIVNELVTNSVKYAFPNGGQGVIGVQLQSKGDAAELTVWDNGVGVGVGVDAKAKASSGRGGKLLEIFARQAGGSLGREPAFVGTRHIVRFPVGGPP